MEGPRVEGPRVEGPRVEGPRVEGGWRAGGGPRVEGGRKEPGGGQAEGSRTHNHMLASSTPNTHACAVLRLPFPRAHTTTHR